MSRTGSYLQPGDKVFHSRYPQWGIGEVVEVWTSRVPGGVCFAHVVFQDGRKRVFDNNFESQNCCYYAGLRIYSSIEF